MSEFCPWCQNKNGNTDLDFSVIDDNYGSFIPWYLINFCPFCGREIRDYKTHPVNAERRTSDG